MGAAKKRKIIRLLEATLTRGEGAVSAKLADLRSAYDVQERELLHARRQVTAFERAGGLSVRDDLESLHASHAALKDVHLSRLFWRLDFV